MKAKIRFNEDSEDTIIDFPFLRKPRDTVLITIVRYLFLIFSLIVIYTTISDIYGFDDYFNKLNYFTENVIQISSFVFAIIFFCVLDILRDKEEKYLNKLLKTKPENKKKSKLKKSKD